MNTTYENVLVTCMSGECCPSGTYMIIHRLICPDCENVIWVVSDEILSEDTLTMSSYKCDCPDCGFVFKSGDKCWVCGKGTSFYHSGDAVFTEGRYQEIMERKLNKCLISKAEYIENFIEVRKQSEKNELSTKLKAVKDEISIKIEEYKNLEVERDLLAKDTKNYDADSLPNEMRKRILDSIEKFKEWESRIKVLNSQYDEIKEKMEASNNVESRKYLDGTRTSGN